MDYKSQMPTDLFVKQLNNNITSDESSELINWINSAKENRDTYKSFRKMWIINGSDIMFNSDQGWKNVESKIFRQRQKLKITLLKQFAVAASIAILLSVGVFKIIMSTNNVNTITVNVALGSEPQQVILPDSSVVWLNGNSKIEYPKVFEDDKRIVNFAGEAYFQIAKNAAKPFEIHSDKAITRILGTSFNLNTKHNSNQTKIDLFTGKVEYINKSTSKSVIVLPNQYAFIDSSNDTPILVNELDKNILAWKTKHFEFNSQELSDVLAQVAKVYNVKFNVVNPVLNNVKVTISFNSMTIDGILNVLSETVGFSYTKSGKSTFIIKEKND